MTLPQPDAIIYPIELRPGVYAKVQAPTDMTKSEAEKISRVVLALGNGEITKGSDG